MVIDKKFDQVLNSIYFNLQNATAFSGVNNLFNEAKKLNKSIKLKDVKDFLARQRTYTLHKPIRRRFPRNKVIAAGIDTHWQADLCDMQNIKEFNDGFGYILTCIDVLSKYGFAEPVITKQTKNVAEAFLKIISKGRKPWFLYTDQGLEFLGEPFQKMLNDNNIIHYKTKDKDIKAPNVERYNRTIKTRLWKYFTHKNTFTWINVLPLFVSGINNSVNRMIKSRPIDITEDNDQDLWKKLYGNKIIKKEKPLYKIGDSVRISKYKTIFEKGYLPNFSEEIFTISKILYRIPLVYELDDKDDEKIDGVFYEKELVKLVKSDKIYIIEKVMKTRKNKNGEKELYVKWKGYPSKFNQWIQETEVVTTK